MNSTMDIVKRELRRKFLNVRKNLPERENARLSARIARNIFSLPRVANSDLVMVYHKIGAEVDTDLLIELVIASGRGVALPYAREDESIGIGRIWSPISDLVPGPYGAMEPVDRLKGNVRSEQVGAVVCPGAAFDKNGGRLGRGGGYYDRFLQGVKGRAQIIGCAFDCQISGDPLPLEEHDIRMDVIVTETRAFPKGACPAVRILDEIEAYKENVKL